MKIDDCFEIAGFTVLTLSENRPKTNWNTLRIEGLEYAPQIVMDAADNVIAIKGSYNLAGKTLEFV